MRIEAKINKFGALCFYDPARSRRAAPSGVFYSVWQVPARSGALDRLIRAAYMVAIFRNRKTELTFRRDFIKSFQEKEDTGRMIHKTWTDTPNFK